MKICVVGAGAIGGLMGARFALAGQEVTLIDLGAHLAAIRGDGLKLIGPEGEEVVARELEATDDMAEAGPQDLVVIAVKAHQIAAMAPEMRALFGNDTAVLTVQNGIPWWYFQNHGGKFDGHRIEAVDLTGNRSELSELVSGRAFDQQPPVAPIWTDPAMTVNVDGNTVLTWAAAADDPGLVYQVQRQSDESPMWRNLGVWSEPDVTTFEDETVRESGQTYRYRVRAMDAAGNRSAWSEKREITLP